MNNDNWGHRLQSLPKPILYLILALCTSLPLIPKLHVPNKPQDPAEDFYSAMMSIPEGSSILVETDWTGSTRGESGGEFESFLKILMRRKINIAFYSAGDAQAPQVAKDAINRMNIERQKDGQPAYKQWDNWINLGYLPNAEAAGQAIANNVRNAFPGRKAIPSSGGSATDSFESPVLKGKTTLKDFPLLVVVTASNTINVAIERFTGKVKMAGMVTGVMGPEAMNYYTTNQLVGLVVGLKGLYDMESLMERGINDPAVKDTVVNEDKFQGKTVPGFPGMKNEGKATLYYPTLHFALALLLLAVLAGNVGMFLSKKGAEK